MSDFEPLSDKDIEALLGGSAAKGHEAWNAVIDRIRREAAAPLDPARAQAQIARAAQAAGAGTEAPGRRASRIAWRRRTVFTGLLSTIFGKIVVGTAAVAIAAAGAGAAGVLPDPIESFLDQNLIGDDAADEVVHQIRTRQQEQVQLHIDDEKPAGDQNQEQNGDQVQNHGEDPQGDQNQNHGDGPPDDGDGNGNQDHGDGPPDDNGGNGDQNREQNQSGDCEDPGSCGGSGDQNREQNQSGELDRDRDQDQPKHQDNPHQGDPDPADGGGSDGSGSGKQGN